jgi:hypothetical protein
MSTHRTEASAGQPMARTVTVTGANIYLSREICDTFFPGISSVALVARDERLLVVPLIQDSSGGTLLKIRNRHGDRVIQAQEFFRDKGFVEDAQEQEIAAVWSAESAAMVLDGVRKSVLTVQR